MGCIHDRVYHVGGSHLRAKVAEESEYYDKTYDACRYFRVDILQYGLHVLRRMFY